MGSEGDVGAHAVTRFEAFGGRPRFLEGVDVEVVDMEGCARVGVKRRVTVSVVLPRAATTSRGDATLGDGAQVVDAG